MNKMVSVKALAAIALTLMIAVPIGLGYGLAMHNVQYEEWTSEESINLSQTILNSSTAYDTESFGSNNNAQLIQSWTYIGPGVTEYHSVAPDYQSVGTKATSIPEYASSTVNYSLTSAATSTFPLPGSVYHIGSSNWTYDTLQAFINASRDLIVLTIDTTVTSPIHWEIETDISNTDFLDVSRPIELYRDGAGTWTMNYYGMSGNTTLTGVGAFCLTTDATGTVTCVTRESTELDSDITGLTYSFETSSSNPTAIKLSGIGGDTYVTTTSQTVVSASGQSVLVGSTNYVGISSVSVCFPASLDTLPITKLAATGNYADPAQGWKVPIPTDPDAFATWWTNNCSNDSVTFMLKFNNVADVYLGPGNGTGLSDATYRLRYSSGQVLVNNVVLGAYNTVKVVISTEGLTVSGINAWPSMGSEPAALNTITVDNPIPRFNTVNINATNADLGNILFRVDKAEVLAGYFPSTNNYTLDMEGLFPAKSYSLKLNSIGIYGDTINIAGTSFGVTNGRISLGGNLVPLKGAVIKSLGENGVYSNTINGFALSDTAAPAQIYFGGEWSLTITGELMNETTNTRTEWQPGEFAFDKRDFAAVGLMVAGACLVGLGMTGQRSGVKMGVLLLICGGAAFAYLTML